MANHRNYEKVGHCLQTQGFSDVEAKSWTSLPSAPQFSRCCRHVEALATKPVNLDQVSMESSDILVALVSLKWEIKGQVDCSHKRVAELFLCQAVMQGFAMLLKRYQCRRLYTTL